MKKAIIFTLFFVPMLFQAQGSVTFRISNMGSTVEGQFERFNLDIQWNESNPAASTISGSVYVESINTGIALRDRHLRSSSYFHVSKFPEITFQSKKIEKGREPGTYKIIGNLTIKDVTKEHIFVLSFTPSGGREFTTTLNRREFNVGGWSLTMGDEVWVKVAE